VNDEDDAPSSLDRLARHKARHRTPEEIERNRMLRAKEVGLSPLQEIFVKEYLIDLNATQAWIRAGGDPASASRVAFRLMRKGTQTKNAIDRAMAERSMRTGISADRVIREYARIAFGDPRVLFGEDGSLRAPHEYNEDDARMIEGVKTRRIVEVAMDPDTGKQKLVPVEIQEVKLASKTTALQALGRHLGLFNDKIDVNITTPLDQRFAEAMSKITGDPTDPRPTVIDGDAEEIDDEDDEDEGDDELRRLLG